MGDFWSPGLTNGPERTGPVRLTDRYRAKTNGPVKGTERFAAKTNGPDSRGTVIERSNYKGTVIERFERSSNGFNMKRNGHRTVPL